MRHALTLALLTSIATPSAFAKPACDELAGSVIFFDTLYGVGTGAVVSALVLAAGNDSQDVGSKMAGGTLIGASIGLVAGVIELGVRDCNDKAADSGVLKSGLTLTSNGPALALTVNW